ncbi:MAG: peptidylprolyl isomerase [Candidatus Hydrothermarchaeales archaeon]
MVKAKEGDFVRVSYTGRFEDGRVFDSTDEGVARAEGIYVKERKYGPLSITIGSSPLIDGFSEALAGMKVGEEKEVVIPPEKAYGDVDEDLIKSVPIGLLKVQDIPAKVGTLIETNDGIGRIIEVDGERVKLDFNHPLAGKTLIFKIKLEELKNVK